MLSIHGCVFVFVSGGGGGRKLSAGFIGVNSGREIRGSVGSDFGRQQHWRFGVWDICLNAKRCTIFPRLLIVNLATQFDVTTDAKMVSIHRLHSNIKNGGLNSTLHFAPMTGSRACQATGARSGQEETGRSSRRQIPARRS